jgi:ferredoxin
MCGTCVRTCPAGAKRIRNDLHRAKLLLQGRKPVYLSLAPSWHAEFGAGCASLIAAAKRLGFAGVSETALGAQRVSAAVAKLLAEGEGGLHISSACPTIVDYVLKHKPKLAGRITPLLSPLLAHCKLLREQYGEEIAIVFAGPCVAKKSEADSFAGLLDVSITFKDLRRWFSECGIDYAAPAEGSFVPHEAKEGALYPVDGGMIAGIKAGCAVTDAGFMSFSGLNNIAKLLSGLEDYKPEKPVFLELLACEGGCVNGPAMENEASSALKRLDVITMAPAPEKKSAAEPALDLGHIWSGNALEAKRFTEKQIRGALKLVGKMHSEDELNCSGCGYESCRQFAEALLEERAEVSMCVSYMRRLAHKKADMLIKTMPGGVVIVDEKLCVVESNKRFAAMLGEDVEQLYEDVPGLEKAQLASLLPDTTLFKRVLAAGTGVAEADCNINNAVLHLTVFSIEAHRLVGAFLQDITAPAVAKEQIINRAKNVIEKNLQTVQKIAYLLGENAADSELILNSIVDSFGSKAESGGNE